MGQPMENSREILSFSDIDIIEYLNNTHRKYDYFLVETQKHNIKKYMNEINDKLRLSFIANSESLLAILDTYQYCQDTLFACKLPRLAKEELSNLVHSAAHTDFENKSRLFGDSISLFVTKERTLICDAMFENELYYILLTNDLLFIGKLKNAASPRHPSPQYEVLHTVKNKHVKMKRKSNKISIYCPSNVKYSLNGDRSNVKNFYNAFYELTYSPDLQHEEKYVPNDVLRMVEYYVETRQFQEIGELLENNSKMKLSEIFGKGSNNSAMFCMQPRNQEELRSILDVFDNESEILSLFVLQRFNEAIRSINKVQELSELINSLFDYLEGFVRELKKVLLDINIPMVHHVILTEQIISSLFYSLEPRLFGRIHEFERHEVHMNLIEKRLLFGGYDFTYMMESLDERRKAFAERCLEEAKLGISSRLEKLGV